MSTGGLRQFVCERLVESTEYVPEVMKNNNIQYTTQAPEDQN